ncbi:MAG TPA: tetratricopeptide repeat protein [Myxococcota bacterium]
MLRCSQLVVVVSLLAASAGCITTRAEGDQLRADVDALKEETSHLQTELADARAQRELVKKLEARVVELEGTLSALRQADADGGVQIEKLVAEVQNLRGELEEARHELGEQKATVESILARPPVAVATAATAPKVENDPNKPTQIGGEDVPADAKEHYAFAKRLFDDKKFAESAEAFDLFLTRHATGGELVDNAAFWKAESYYQLGLVATDKTGKEKAYKQAILSYQRVLETPKSAKADGALFKIGLSFEQLGFQEEARVFYEELLSKHPKSPLAGEGKKRLAALKPAKKKK